jgi:DNA-binding NarL/FixJ family response regulator
LLDVLIVGDPMPGFEAVLKGLQRQSGCRVAVLTDLEDPPSLSSPRGAGVSAYIPKVVSGLELVATVKEVHEGRSFVTAEQAARFKASAETLLPYRARKQGDFLSHRERQALQHVSKGLSNKKIAVLLGLSVVTVKHCITHLFKKRQAPFSAEDLLEHFDIAALIRCDFGLALAAGRLDRRRMLVDRPAGAALRVAGERGRAGRLARAVFHSGWA